MPTEDVYIDFECPSCKTSLSVPEELAGVEGPCPVCDTLVTAPKPPEPVEEPAKFTEPVEPPQPEPRPYRAMEPPPQVELLPEPSEEVPIYQKPAFRWARIVLAVVSLVALACIALELKKRGVFERPVDPPAKLPKGMEPQIGPGSPSTKPADFEKRLADELLKE